MIPQGMENIIKPHLTIPIFLLLLGYAFTAKSAEESRIDADMRFGQRLQRKTQDGEE